MRIIVESHPEKRLTPEQCMAGGGKGFIYHESIQSVYRTKIVLKDLFGEPIIYTNRIFGPVYNISKLTKWIKNIEQIQKGKVHLHAGAVARDENHGILIFGLHRSGKTSLLLNLAKSGLSIIGDDSVLLSDKGDIEQMKNTIGIYPDSQQYIRYPKLLKREKVTNWFKRNFSKNPYIYNFIRPQINIDKNRIGKTLKSAKLRTVVIVERGQPSITSLDKKTAINKLLVTSLNRLIPDGFPRRLTNLYCYYNNISPTFVGDKIKEILDSALNNKTIINIKAPNPNEAFKLLSQYDNVQKTL